MAYKRGNEGPASVFYKAYASYFDETPPAIRRLVAAVESRTNLPRRGVPTWPVDADTVARTAEALVESAHSLFHEELDVGRNDPSQLDRFAIEYLVDPQMRRMFDDGRLRDEEAYAALQGEERNRVADEPLLYYALGCFWGEWLVRHAEDARWFLHAPLKPIQSFPDMLRTGTLTALSPFSLATKLLADPAAESLAPKFAAMPSQVLFGPVALCATISDSEEILRELVGAPVERATKLLKQGRTDAAIRLLEDAVEGDPRNGHLLQQAAMLGWEHQRFAFVHRATSLQLALAPDEAEIRHNFAAIESMREGGLERALALLERIVEEEPSYTRARLTLASCLHEAGRDGDARTHAKWLVEHDPDLGERARELLAEL